MSDYPTREQVREIRGVITLADGSTSEFTIGSDGGWQQWNAPTERIGRTVDVMEALVAGLTEAEVPFEGDEPDDDDDDA